MGILNVTPDSFFDGGKYVSADAIKIHVEKMLTDGADIIDVGGYSTRPGAADIPAQEETARVVNAIGVIRRHFQDTIISVDTFRSSVAHTAVNEGASIVNDISGGELDPAMFETVARLQVPYILMHMRGNPQTMTKQTAYGNLIKELMDYFHQKLYALTQLGIKDIIVDPGFGFAKTREQNFQLLDQLEYFKILGKPIMAGLSRKSMIWKTLNTSPENSINGTTALHAIALLKGASILRVHDVKECVEVIKLMSSLKNSAKDGLSMIK